VKLKPNKKLGQNFLIDKNIIKKICNFVYIDQSCDLLEIGPGTGNLTEGLLNKRPKNFYLIEKDKNLSETLKQKFQNKIKIFNDDILTFPLEKILNNKTIVFGNLPYNISSKILTRFILNHNTFKFKLLIFMFQKELANRIIAQIDKSDYGRLTVLSNWRLNIQKIMDISSSSFYPKPKVDSSLLVFSPKKDYIIFKDPNSLEKVTRIIFNERRKKIRNRIKNLFNNDDEIVKKININLNLRPQNLYPEEYFSLAKEYEKLRK
tara:strand:- start:732 stop:1520 length:789 start_codon:yes stop_codon:yes gene_type:complete